MALLGYFVQACHIYIVIVISSHIASLLVIICDISAFISIGVCMYVCMNLIWVFLPEIKVYLLTYLDV